MSLVSFTLWIVIVLIVDEGGKITRHTFSILYGTCINPCLKQ